MYMGEESANEVHNPVCNLKPKVDASDVRGSVAEWTEVCMAAWSQQRDTMS